MPKKTSNNNDKRLEILGILICAVSIFIIISLLGHDPSEEVAISPNVQINNPMGILGVLVSHILIKLGFGYISLILPMLGFYWGWVLFSKKDFDGPLTVSFYSLLLMILLSFSTGVFSIYFSFGISKFQYSGVLSGLVADFFLDMLSIYGCLIFLIASYIMLLRAYFDLDLYKPFLIIKQKIIMAIENYKEARDQNFKENEKRKHTNELKSKIRLDSDSITQDKSFGVDKGIENSEKIIDDPKKVLPQSANNMTTDNYNENATDDLNENATDDLIENEVGAKISDLNIEEMAKNTEVDIDEVEERKKPKRKYILPSSDLLKNPVSISDNLSRDELVDRANYLTQSLSTYGVVGKVVNVHAGPVITLFVVEPAEGVRVNKFVQLADDLARVMEASSVRVIAPIPGKSSVGIEIPNRNPATVYFKSVVNSPEFAESESMLTLAIGKTTSGEISTLDLSKMPHLIISGTTGSGKSV